MLAVHTLLVQVQLLTGLFLSPPQKAMLIKKDSTVEEPFSAKHILSEDILLLL